MQPSKYIEAMKNARPMFLLTGNALLVEIIPWGELKTKGGIIMSAGDTNKVRTLEADLPIMVHVIATGEGYYDDNGDAVPLDINVGDILMLGKNAVKRFPVLPIDGYQADSVGITSENEAQIVWRGIEAYREYESRLNASKEEVEKGT